jgi:hypothetical protein
MEKVENEAKEDIPLLHQVRAVTGLAWLKKGDKKKAAEQLQLAMNGDFKGLQTAVNLDLKLLEEMMKKKVDPALCKTYLEKAHAFSKVNKEKQFEKLFKQLLKNFPTG